MLNVFFYISMLPVVYYHIRIVNVYQYLSASISWKTYIVFRKLNVCYCRLAYLCLSLFMFVFVNLLCLLSVLCLCSPVHVWVTQTPWGCLFPSSWSFVFTFSHLASGFDFAFGFGFFL